MTEMTGPPMFPSQLSSEYFAKYAIRSWFIIHKIFLEIGFAMLTLGVERYSFCNFSMEHFPVIWKVSANLEIFQPFFIIFHEGCPMVQWEDWRVRKKKHQHPPWLWGRTSGWARGQCLQCGEQRMGCLGQLLGWKGWMGFFLYALMHT